MIEFRKRDNKRSKWGQWRPAPVLITEIQAVVSEWRTAAVRFTFMDGAQVEYRQPREAKR